MYEQRRSIPTYWYENQFHRGFSSENLGGGCNNPPPPVRRVAKNSLVRRGLTDQYYPCFQLFLIWYQVPSSSSYAAKVLLLPLVPKGGGVPWNSLQKTTFHRNYAMKFAPYMYALLETIIPEKIKMLHRSKWRPNNRFLFRVVSILAKIWKKKHFPKGIFQWNLAQSRRTWIDLHYWNNIFKRNYSVSKWWPKQFLEIVQ